MTELTPQERIDKAKEARLAYERMDDDEKCAFAGKLIRRQTYARVLMPHRVDALLECRVCERRPSACILNQWGHAICLDGTVCKPKTAVARWDQIPPWVIDPSGPGWLIRLLTAMGGRGSGKSFTATGWFIPEVLERPDYRMGCLGPDFGISVGVAIVGPAGFKTRIQAFDPSLIWKHDEQKNLMTLVNGSTIKSLSTENLKTLEGPEYHGYWADELAELRGQGGENDVWVKRARPGVRLVGKKGEPTRAIMSGTPEATPLIKWLHDQTRDFPKAYAWAQLATRDNQANIDDVDQQYEEARDANGELNRYGQAKLEGVLILESPKALLTEADLAAIRVDAHDPRHRTPQSVPQTVLVVDSNHSEDKKSDECGIMVAGRNGRTMHLFADASLGGGPKKWGERIIEVLVAYPEINVIVVEDDKSMVIDVVKRVLRDELQRIGRPIKVEPIHHKNRSKKKRADPVAVEYQIKHVLHDPCSRTPQWSSFKQLEWQWVSWNPEDTGPKAKSPDRLDAAVYAGEFLLIIGRETDSWAAPGQAAAGAARAQPPRAAAPAAKTIHSPRSGLERAAAARARQHPT